MRLRLGFIGAGIIAQLAHMANYREIEGCELAAIADDRARSAQVAARKYGVEKVYRDFREMLNVEKLDGIVISSGFRLHHALIPEVIEHGIPILTDVPIAASVETAQQLVRMAEKRGVPYHLGYVRRFDPAVNVAKEIIEKWRRSSECGRITYVRITMPFRTWPYGGIAGIEEDAEDGGFGILPEPIPDRIPGKLKTLYLRFITFYINQINLLRYLIEEEIEIRYVDPNNRLIVMISEGGITCSLEMAQYGLRNRWEEFYKVCFEEGKIDLKLAAPLSRDASDVLIYRGGSGELLRPDLPREWAARRMAEHFVDSILSGAEPISPADDGIKDLIAAEQYIRCRNIGRNVI